MRKNEIERTGGTHQANSLLAKVLAMYGLNEGIALAILRDDPVTAWGEELAPFINVLEINEQGTLKVQVLDDAHRHEAQLMEFELIDSVNAMIPVKISRIRFQ